MSFGRVEGNIIKYTWEEHLRLLAKLGNLTRSDKKRAAARRNLKIANEVRASKRLARLTRESVEICKHCGLPRRLHTGIKLLCPNLKLVNRVSLNKRGQSKFQDTNRTSALDSVDWKDVIGD